MKKTTFIYTISDEFGVIRYIGKSNNPKNRIYNHINEKSNRHKYNWLKSIIRRGKFPIVEVIEEVPYDNWEMHEVYWISQFKAWGFNLLNLTFGGEDGGYKHTFESKKKMRLSKLGTKLSKEHKEKISESIKKKSSETPLYNRGKGNSRIVLDKDLLYQKYIIENLSLNKCASFFNVSKKTIFTNIKEYNFKKVKEDWKNQLITNPVKPVIQYDLSGNKLSEFSSASEANKKTKTNISSISNCCLGRQKSAGGFIWIYKTY